MQINTAIRFPFYPKPYDNEVLSSYIARISVKNGTKPYSILQSIGCTNEAIGRNVRLNVNTNIDNISLRNLSDATGVDQRILENLTFRQYYELFYDNVSSLRSWEVSNSLWFNATKIKICPICLKERNYYRLSWKLQYVNTCDKHNVFLIDRCQKCNSLINDINGTTRAPNKIGYCERCGYDYTGAVMHHVDRFGVVIQRQIEEYANCSSSIQISKDLSIDKKAFFAALKVLCKLVPRLDINDSLIYKGNIGSQQLLDLSGFFRLKGFTTAKGFPANKITSPVFNHVVFTAAFKLLLNWPTAFYQLLDKIHQSQSMQKSRTITRVFGLMQKVHTMLLVESPVFMRNAYYRWIRNKNSRNKYFQNKEFLIDAHLRKYSGYERIGFPNNNQIPVMLNDESWKHLKRFFQFPDSSIGSGNLYNRSIKRARIFCAAYMYKVNTGCSWQNVPAVKEGLIKPGGLYQRLTILRRRCVLAEFTGKIIELIYKLGNPTQ